MRTTRLTRAPKVRRRIGPLPSSLLAIALCAFLVAAYLWRILFLGEVPLQSPVNNITDVGASALAYAPGWEVLKRVLKSGDSLLWISARNSGTPPLYEELSAAFLHPWSWFCCLFEFGNSWRVNALGLMFMLSLAHVAIARRILRFSWPATACFVQVAVFNFFLMRNLNHIYLLVYTGAIWNWYFLLESLQPRPKGFWALIFLGESLSIAWGLSGGFPEAFFPALIMGCLLLGFSLLVGPRASLAKAVFTLVAAAAIGAGLSCIGLFSFAEGYSLLHAEVGRFRDGVNLSTLIPAPQLPRLVMNFEVMGKNVVYYTVGGLPFILMMIGFWAKPWRKISRAVVLTLLSSALFFLVHVSHLLPPFSHVIASLPFIGMSNFYAYYPPLLSMAVAWLAAAGLDALYLRSECFRDRHALKKVIRTATIFLLVILVLYHALPHGTLHKTSYLCLLPVFVAIPPLRRLLSANESPPHLRGVYVASLLVLIFLADFCFMNGFRYASSALAEEGQFGVRDRRLVDTVCARSDVKDYRWFWWDKIPKDFCVNHPDSPASATMLPRNHLLKNALFRRDLFLEAPRFPYSLGTMSIRWYGADQAALRQLKRWGESYKLLYPLTAGWSLVEIKNVLPRAFVTHRCQWVNDRGGARAVFEGGGYRFGSAVLEKNLAHSLGWGIACGESSKSVEAIPIMEDTGASLKLAAARGPGVLVLNDSFYPGWSATDETGQALPIVPGNLAYRAIALDQPKEYRVTFTYRPAWFGTARAIWIASVLIWLAVLTSQLRPALGLTLTALARPWSLRLTSYRADV